MTKLVLLVQLLMQTACVVRSCGPNGCAKSPMPGELFLCSADGVHDLEEFCAPIHSESVTELWSEQHGGIDGFCTGAGDPSVGGSGAIIPCLQD